MEHIVCGIENPGSQDNDKLSHADVYVTDGSKIRGMEKKLDEMGAEHHVMVDPDVGETAVMWRGACALGSTAADVCQKCPWPSQKG